MHCLALETMAELDVDEEGDHSSEEAGDLPSELDAEKSWRCERCRGDLRLALPMT